MKNLILTSLLVVSGIVTSENIIDIYNEALENDPQYPVKFFETFLFQFINPKAVMVSIIVISTFVDTGENYMLTLIWVMVIIFIVALFSICFWTILGKFFKKFATNNNFIKRFNYAMSLLLIVCIIGFYI